MPSRASTDIVALEAAAAAFAEALFLDTNADDEEVAADAASVEADASEAEAAEAKALAEDLLAAADCAEDCDAVAADWESFRAVTDVVEDEAASAAALEAVFLDTNADDEESLADAASVEAEDAWPDAVVAKALAEDALAWAAWKEEFAADAEVAASSASFSALATWVTFRTRRVPKEVLPFESPLGEPPV